VIAKGFFMANVQNQPITNSLLSNMNGTKASNKAAGSSGAAGSGDSTSSATSTQAMTSDFMTMLIAQMKYQDPTKPVDSAQMTSQLAQISTVDGINQLNTTMSSLVSSLQASQEFQAASMVGHSVMTQGNALTLNGSGPAKFAVQLDKAVDSLDISITNAAGEAVGAMRLGPQAAGTVPVTWAGTDASGNALPNGRYSYQVQALSNGKPVSNTPLQYSTVQSISAANGGVTLNLDDKTSIGASGVMQIL
jgi:flagellar basal-body rod modification protein FlgD